MHDSRALIATVIAIAALAFSASASLAVGAPSGFVGSWTTIDCATSGDAGLDCAVWGDGSVMTLVISPGDAPQAVFQDTYATACANDGSQATRWVAVGTGEYDADHLWLTLSKSGCGTSWMGGYGGVQLYHDPGSDTIWEDEDGDGWGLIWYRTPGGAGPTVAGNYTYTTSSGGQRSASINAHGTDPVNGTWSWQERSGPVTCFIVDGPDAWLAGPGTTGEFSGVFIYVHDGGAPGMADDLATAWGQDPDQPLDELLGWCQSKASHLELFPLTGGNVVVQS